MSMQRSIRLRTCLAGAIAFALFGVTSIATAQPLSQASQQMPPPPPPPPAQPAMPPPPQQPMPPPPPATPMQSQPMQSQPMQSQPMPDQQQGNVQFYQGTKSTATYPMQGGGTLVVHSGMPKDVHYAPPPSFKSLDTNHDGRISEQEAQAYPPLDNSFLFVSHHAKTVSKAEYEKWSRNLH